MGLTISAKGLKETYDCGYLSFMLFRQKVAKTYNERVGELYIKYINEGLDDDEIQWFESNTPQGLLCFLLHSDCSGKFTPQECKLIYDVIKDLHMEEMGHNYGEMEPYNVLERWKTMLQYCYKRRVNMYFT